MLSTQRMFGDQTGLTHAGDPLSPDALQNLRFYKYSSIDKSPLSKYVLKHYVGREILNFESRAY